MHDGLIYLFWAVVLVGTGSLTVAAGCAVIALARGVGRVLGSVRRAGRDRRPAPPRPAAAAALYRACHTTVCGHMTMPHDPAGPGQWICRGCGTAAAEV